MVCMSVKLSGDTADYGLLVLRRQGNLTSTLEELGKHAAFRERSLPYQPTSAVPGTEDKIRVLRQRAARKLRLHHPGDCRTVGFDFVAVLTEVARNGRTVNAKAVSDGE